MDIENLLYLTALKSPMEYKYACVIMRRNKIESVGYNSYKRKFSLGSQCLLRD